MSKLDSNEQTQLLELTRTVDSVELKLSVADDDHGKTAQALGLDPIEAEIRQVYFFDTPDLALDAAGVVARARRIQGGSADTVIKLRPVVPDELPKDVRKSKSMKIEVDLMPGKFVCSASMKGKAESDDVKKAAAGEIPMQELFSDEQKSFFETYAPKNVKLGDLVPLGPILTLKLKFPEEGLGEEQDLVAELWFYPDNTRILELSTKCEPDHTFQAVAESKSFLASKGVDLDAKQKTKTKTALQYFSKIL